MIDERTSREDVKLDTQIAIHLSSRYVLGRLYLIVIARVNDTSAYHIAGESGVYQ